MELAFIIDVLLYTVILIVTYIVFNKVFARSNISKILICSWLVKVVSLYFKLEAISSLVDVALISIFVCVVISNEQKINKLMKRKKTPRSKQNSNGDRKQLYKVF